MTQGNDPYGIADLKAKEEAEKEKDKKNELFMEEIMKSLKGIGDKLGTIETMIDKITPGTYVSSWKKE